MALDGVRMLSGGRCVAGPMLLECYIAAAGRLGECCLITVDAIRMLLGCRFVAEYMLFEFECCA
eukprot:10431485-Lingulodinium_polyedra.AAC.1